MASVESDIISDLRRISFTLRSQEERRAIVKQGRLTPALEIVKKDGRRTRQFQPSWYGVHKWLTGSAVTNKLYCWPCLLLSTKKHIWANEGYCDWKNLSRSASLHRSSHEHIKNEVSLKRLEHAGAPGDARLGEQRRLAVLDHNEKVRKNREVLKRLIDISVVLSRQEFASRGHRETQGSGNQRHFTELVGYFFRHDQELKFHWQKNASVFSDLSKTIQNELMECVAEEITSCIDREVEECSFFACEVDGTTDVSQLSQLALTLRYVDRKGNTQERFLGFKDVGPDRTAVALKQVVDSEISKYNYKGKLVSQSYDGAAVLAGELGGLQALIKKDAPQALLVHCFNHRLNLILQQGAQCIQQTRCFFATLQGFPAFFTRSSKCTELLHRIVGRIPSLCAARWTPNSTVLHAIASEREKLCQVFQEIVDGSGWDGECRRQAAGFLAKLNDFQFIFLLYCYRSIFSITDVLCDVLQKNAADVNECNSQVHLTVTMIGDLRKEEHFKEVLKSAANSLSDLPAPPKQPRVKLEDEPPADGQSAHFLLYNDIIDNILVQILLRFADIKALQFLPLSDSSRFPAFRKQFPTDAFSSLADSYGSYFDLDRLKSEFGVIFRDDQFQNRSVSDILLLINETGLCEVLAEVYRFFSLIATIPATAVCEESRFSCLERIKAYLRSAVEQDHLSARATISIETKLLSFLETQPNWILQDSLGEQGWKNTQEPKRNGAPQTKTDAAGAAAADRLLLCLFFSSRCLSLL
ncbi:uncharacterized protein LOC117964775 isoform X1 [Acipenser ruthenus]|uniref:uncharacterized protein LOC117964775 isoform X1 n=1 Tax=Acipenser ruthenus TaxID=7906 RepID=UPI0027422580|nr:uncharacterized protein LOC117964775 isoform X1 [Acipenser ruthenus]